MADKYYLGFPTSKTNRKIEMNNSNLECLLVSFLYSGKTKSYFYHCFISVRITKKKKDLQA